MKITKDYIRRNHPEIIEAIRKQARKELEESGAFKKIMEQSAQSRIHRNISKRAGTDIKE